MKIIFMGTPEFACPTLQKLLLDPFFEIVAIYTREPQIAGRGHKLTNSPIHELALKHNLFVITPKTLRDKKVQQEFCKLKADAAVVVAYGLILPIEILNAVKFGCINLHPSLLPRWRGPSPIQYTFFSGDNEIGVTIIKMNEGIDSGDIIMQSKFALKPDDNYSCLAPQLARLGGDMVIESLKNLYNNKASLIKQNEDLATFSKKIKKEESKINWDLSAEEILCKIRGLSGLLTAYFEFNGEIIKIYDAKIIKKESLSNIDLQECKAGKVINKNFTIKCGKDFIQPLILQRQGKNRISIEDFLRGFKIA